MKENSRLRRAERSEQHKAKSWAREWLDALVFAGIAALIIRTFLFEAYRIPTPSMENTLMTGDFLVVSKFHYGARTPMAIGIPFTQIHIPNLTLPWMRLPAWSDVERNDIVVFNYPIDETVIAKKTHYVKRCVAIAGDSVALINARLYINGDLSKQHETLRRFYEVVVRDRIRLSPSKVKKMGAEIRSMLSENSYIVNMTQSQAEEMKGWSEVADTRVYSLPVSYNEFGQTRFAFARGFGTNHHNMSAFQVPYKGQEIELNRETWHLYQDIVGKYEENVVQLTSAGFVINGVPSTTYTIKKDYYFMMGDNRDDSEDSRFWGFVPDDHIVGNPSMIYFSWDKEALLPRFDRLFNIVRD